MSNALPLPFTNPQTPEEIQANFDAIGLAFGGLFGGRSSGWRLNADTMTGDGTALKTKTITHGLGKTPVIAFVQAADFTFNTGADTIGATTFRAVLRHVDNAGWSSTQTFYWLAIG